ncbi:hypothetical protein OIDMADRAFT_34113 [Oidiodendron maius Zn]|uniref:Uncharacterized protein n=1 Tax=Oidiodendron maius (strain Zn) TaxID=913774 RepID=A0A0C3D0B0_OIDMZ|nr:hypothetical protein OIDMADRAFT_34113 [Oidiodendron maius Zn]
MLLHFNSEDGHLKELANYPDGTAILEATDESNLASDGNEYPFRTGDTLDYAEGMSYFTQNIYPSPKVAITETTSPASGYSVFQWGGDTLGVDWALWPYCYEPGGTMRCTP